MDKTKDMKRNKELIDLYEKGVSASKLAKIYDISRVRVYQILDEMKIKYTENLTKQK